MCIAYDKQRLAAALNFANPTTGVPTSKTFPRGRVVSNRLVCAFWQNDIRTRERRKPDDAIVGETVWEVVRENVTTKKRRTAFWKYIRIGTRWSSDLYKLPNHTISIWACVCMSAVYSVYTHTWAVKEWISV